MIEYLTTNINDKFILIVLGLLNIVLFRSISQKCTDIKLEIKRLGNLRKLKRNADSMTMKENYSFNFNPKRLKH